MEPLPEEVQKRLFKEALNEWLDKKFAEFGWFSLKAMAVAAFAIGIWLYAIMTGWHK